MEYNNNSSWATLIENDLNDKSNDQILNNSSILDNNLTIYDLLKLDYKNIGIKKIIDYQYIIANEIKRYIKNYIDKKEKFDYNLLRIKLEWLSNINNYLSKKLNLPINNVKEINGNGEEVIPRSSYKFCEYSYDCKYNYPCNINKNNKLKGCNKQHFVYNLLKSDIDAILLYLTKINKENINYEQINKCMNTICYVISKMKNEIENLYSKYKDNYENYHIERIHIINK